MSKKENLITVDFNNGCRVPKKTNNIEDVCPVDLASTEGLTTLLSASVKLLKMELLTGNNFVASPEVLKDWRERLVEEDTSSLADRINNFPLEKIKTNYGYFKALADVFSQKTTASIAKNDVIKE